MGYRSRVFIWYLTVRSSLAVKETVATAGVQVVFVGLFTTVVTNCLRILDCDKGFLLLDPSLPCPLTFGGAQLLPVVLSISIFFVYAFMPLVVLTRLTYGWTMEYIVDKTEESTSFRIKYAWAIQKYKNHRRDRRASGRGPAQKCQAATEKCFRPENWESFNVSVKIVTISGSVMMYETNRLIALLVVTVLSVYLHAVVRPYKDVAGNVTVILFCLCDVLGVVSTLYPIAQIPFLICLLLTLVVVVYFSLKAARTRIHDMEMAARALSAMTCLPITSSSSNG